MHVDAITVRVLAAIDDAAEVRGQEADHGALTSVAEGIAAVAHPGPAGESVANRRLNKSQSRLSTLSR